MKDYYNLSQLKRVYAVEDTLSDRWRHYVPKSVSKINWLFNNKLYTSNQTRDVYVRSRYYLRSEKIPYYTLDNLKEQLDSSEYFDIDNKEVRTFPKVVLSWCDGSKTEIYFATNDEANNYVDILVAKCKEGGNVLLALSKY